MDLNRPYAIVPAVLQEMLSTRERIDASKAAPRPEKADAQMDFSGGVAIVPITGILTKRPTIWGRIFQETVTGGVEADLRTALDLPAVKAVILAIDSPGGGVDGTAELASFIFKARGEKPIVAWTDGTMASAAYWIGSAAGQVFISGDTVQVGSIGVVAAHRDFSGAEARLGVKTTEVVAGRYKRIASSYAPLTEEGRGAIQEAVDYIYSAFVADVARFRGVSEDAVLDRMADGKVFFGKQAIEAGLADGVTTLEALVSRLAAGAVPKTSGADARAGRGPLSPPAKPREKTFGELVDAYQAENGCSRGEAIRKTVHAHPEAHERYLQELNG